MKLSSLFPGFVALVFAATVIAAGPEGKGQEAAKAAAAEAIAKAIEAKASGSANHGASSGGNHGANDGSQNGAAERAPANEYAPPVAISARSGDYDSCVANNTVLGDLQKRQQDLETREKELRARETDLKARESAISDELRKLESLRKDISGLKAARRQKNEEQVAKLIETVEKMSPKSAAGLLSRVDEDLAVATMNGVSTDKLAKIMGNMEMSRSVRLSELLAMGENAPAREPSAESGKGGASGAASRP